MTGLTGPQRIALFLLRDETSSGGAYLSDLRMKVALSTLRVLRRLGFVEGDTDANFRGKRFILITQLGRDAIYELPRPKRMASARRTR